MRWPSSSAFLTVATVSLLFACAAQSSQAATSPCSTASDYFDGGASTGITQYGVKADIETQNPAICGSSSASAVWVMESGHEPAGTGNAYWGWAQAGYIHWGSGQGPTGLHVFSQWCESHCGNIFNLNTKSFSAPTGTENYSVNYNFNSGNLVMWNGSTTLDQTAFDPLVSWVYPWELEIFGETYQCESDVPGTQSNPVKISSIQKMYDRSYDWNQVNDLGLWTPDCSGRYHRGWVTQPTSFNIWTYPLS